MTARWPLAAAMLAASLAFVIAPTRADDGDEDWGVGADQENVLDAEGFRGPRAVYEGEDATFYVPSGAKHVDKEFEALTSDYQTICRFQNTKRFGAGKCRIRLVKPDPSEGRILLVKPLPPRVSPSAPIRERRACVQIYVWDGDATTLGRDLEEAGRIFGPVITGRNYPVKWILAGRQATRRNVGYAIDTLAERGWVVDVFASVHGYPIELADGPWTDIGAVKGLRSVRLFYTTACYGARGSNDFLAAGVRAYVAARDFNFVSAVHMIEFFRSWHDVFCDARTASAEAFRFCSNLFTSDLGKKLAPHFERHADAHEKLDLEGSRPIVFGDERVTIGTDPAKTPAPPRAAPASPTTGIAGGVARSP